MSGLGTELAFVTAKLAISGVVIVLVLTAWVVALYVWIMLRVEAADSGRWQHLGKLGMAALVSPSKCVQTIRTLLAVDPAAVQDAGLAWGLRLLRLTLSLSVPVVIALLIAQLLFSI